MTGDTEPAGGLGNRDLSVTLGARDAVPVANPLYAAAGERFAGGTEPAVGVAELDDLLVGEGTGQFRDAGNRLRRATAAVSRTQGAMCGDGLAPSAAPADTQPNLPAPRYAENGHVRQEDTQDALAVLGRRGLGAPEAW